MKVTKKVEAEIRGVYGAFWDSYLSGDVKTMGTFLSDDFTLIGTSDGEVFNNKKSAIKYLKATIHQIAGVLSRKNIEIKVTQVNDTVLVNEFSDAYISPDGTPSFYDKFRATVIMKRVRGKWKFIHQHGSLPDSKAEVGETLAAEKIRKENRELREAVKRRTRELEETNRDLEIEASLEKVRARAMTMQSSAELANLIGMIYTELTRLDITLDRCFIMLFDDATGDAIWWMGSGDTRSLKRGYHIPFHKHAPHLAYLKGWKNQASTWKYVLKGDVKKKWDEYLFSKTELAQLPLEIIKNMKVWKVAHLSASFNKYGCITSGTFTPLETTSLNLLARFSRMFEQTYTRFLDLKKAEAQVREAQIEAALERVRSRTMAMHKSDELLDVITVVSEQLQHVGINFNTVSFGKNSSSFDMDFWVAGPDLKLPIKIHAPYSNIPIYVRLKEAYHESRSYFSDTFTAEETKVWNQHLIDHNPELFPEKTRAYLTSWPGMTRSTVLLKNVFLFLINDDFVSYSNEEIETVIRFANVFEQTYTRFIDLQKAESHAREAIAQTSLDRVRAEIASMRTVVDLDRITPLIWRELRAIGIPFIRCGVFIMDESNHVVHNFLSTPDGKAIAVFQLPFDVPGSVGRIVKHWQDKKMFLDYWDDVPKKDFAETLVNRGIFASSQQYLDTLPKEGFHLHFLPFAQGMLYVGNLTQLRDEELILLQSVADAFATAYARYDDFSKLESAKQQVDKTLVNLKQAQQQLVQSEKMASLGELTAGIAHEIQNPLNFVNNFSEVSNELLDEMKTELKAGNLEGARELADSIKQNLEKINHHGKRADGIVKGMLQHSRAGSGQKEPTDLNLLCDEYLRLTYHGYRAKEKSFNAKFQSDFDPTLPKIDVVPQDIGRVFLNLINNAFYAVTEMRKHNNDGYEAMVTVTTKHLSGKVEISIKDNGIGMQEKVKEKIFQPFFTTKPTGQGTGLGLSLSYDIIKAHGGTLEVRSKQGVGSEFIIQLPT